METSEENATVEPEKIEEVEEEKETFVAFVRVFSGTIRKGQKVYVLGPKYDPEKGLKLNKESASIDEVDFDSLNRLVTRWFFA